MLKSKPYIEGKYLVIQINTDNTDTIKMKNLTLVFHQTKGFQSWPFKNIGDMFS